MKIAICDDKIEQLKMIENALKNYVESCSYDELKKDVKISCFNNSFDFLSELEKNESYDIFLLDICMPGVLGTEIAKFVRKRNDKCEIIFLTTSDEFAVDAFALNAAHYLLKPFTQNEFDEAFERAVSKIYLTINKSYTFKIKNGIKTVNLSDVFFIESFNHIQSVHIKNSLNQFETFETRDNISSISDDFKELCGCQFCSPYKGLLVNLDKIRTLEKDKITLANGEVIPVAQRSFVKIKDLYFNYKFGG